MYCDDIQSFNTIIWSCVHLHGALFRYFSLAIIVFSFYLKTECLEGFEHSLLGQDLTNDNYNKIL